MRTVIDYMLVSNDREGAFAENVVKNIERGWQPYGNPLSSTYSFYQAMVKYKQEPKEEKTLVIDSQTYNYHASRPLSKDELDELKRKGRF